MIRWIILSLWSLLPDRCEMPDCHRTGIRGNENLIGGKRMCDGCHARKILWGLEP